MIHPEVSSRSSGIKISREISIDADADIVAARQQGRMLAVGFGFSSSEATIVATAISELACNIIVHATRGEIILSAMSHSVPPALTITARDQGAGIADIPRAMQDGYSTSGRLGIGLAGVQRLMDSFDIVSEVGKGTVVPATKWHSGRSAAGTTTSPGHFAKLSSPGQPPLNGHSPERKPDSVNGTSPARQ